MTITMTRRLARRPAPQPTATWFPNRLLREAAASGERRPSPPGERQPQQRL